MNFKSEYIKWLENETRRLLKGCIIKSSEGPNLYTPDGKPQYNALWTRDFSYMVENAYYFIPEPEIKNNIEYIIRGMRKDGVTPDRVYADGTPVYIAGPSDKPMGEPNIDNAQFLVNLVYDYVKNSNDIDFFRNNKNIIDLAMDYIPLSNDGLVYNDGNKPHSTYGFIDTVVITGELLFCSLLYWLASFRLMELADKIKDGKLCSKYEKRKKDIEKAIFNLYDEKKGVFYSSNGINKKIDVWGNAFAIYINFPLGDKEEKIIDFLIRNYEDYIYCGQIRHLLKGEYWDELFCEVPKERYQNGAYWGTASGWIIYTIYKKDKNLANKIFDDFIEYSQKEGLYECVNNDYKQLPDYVATATNVYGAINKVI